LRSIKFALLLIIGFMLITIGCDGEKKKGPSVGMGKIIKNNFVRIITDAVYAPFEFGKDTGVQGLDVDIGNEIGKTLGFEVKWVKISGYEHLFELMRNGEAEILISAIAIDPKKEAEFSFSTPYYDSGDAIAVQSGKLSIMGLSDLSGKKVGVATARPGDAFMTSQKTISVQKFATLDDAMGSLNRAEVDAVVGDEPLIAYSSVKSFQNTMLLPDTVNKYKYAIVVRKSDPDILEKINETINRMKASGDLKKIEQTWIADVKEKSREKHSKAVNLDKAQKAPKTISVNLAKLSGSWDMSRLDGFKLVFNGASGTYQSTAILTEGNRGNCKFTQPIPPGDYTLNLSILKMTAKVSVPAVAKSSFTMDIKIAQELTIQFK
jgi:ABC-type amino acid transport substrate-binding protein